VIPASPEPLFNVQATQPKRCRSCDTDRKSLCKWASDRHHHGIDNKQPRDCLLRYDPATADFPDGY